MKFILQIFILQFTLIAGEVDQYLAWNHLPNDEAYYINKLFNAEIQKALGDINKNHNDCSCEEAAGRILKHFGIGLNTRLEKMLKNSTEIEKSPNDEIHLNERYKRSIFIRELPSENFEQYQNYSLEIQIDEVINIGGIYIGVDKLTHFTASGYLYYRIYNIAIEQVESEEAAIRMAISMGIYGEKNILGKIPSGVFSYADLESNYQGFQFALDLCNNGPAYLKRLGKGWEISGNFELRNYVNPYWDESYNTSYYYDSQNLSLMPKSQAVLQKIPHYCWKYKTQRVQKIFEYYDQAAEPSYSVKYLQELVEKGEIPDPSPFNIRTICSE